VVDEFVVGGHSGKRFAGLIASVLVGFLAGDSKKQCRFRVVWLLVIFGRENPFQLEE